MIAKKDWALSVLRQRCPELAVTSWHWVASPAGEILFQPQHPAARQLAEAGILFPRRRVTLP